MWAAIAVSNPLLTLLFGLAAGTAAAFLFVWGHDAAHGALFASERVSELLGTIAMLPSLNMYRLWMFGHNKVHHGFTSLSTIDWIWRPLTIDEYRSRSAWGRFVYRLERHPVTCGLHYLLRVWWPGMVRFRPDPRQSRIRGVRTSKAISAVYALVLGALAWWLGGPLTAFAVDSAATKRDEMPRVAQADRRVIRLHRNRHFGPHVEQFGMNAAAEQIKDEIGHGRANDAHGHDSKSRCSESRQV